MVSGFERLRWLDGRCGGLQTIFQADMTYRALELLNLSPDEPAFLLDIGCGSGLSGEILDEEGHIWAGVDVAPSMLGEFMPTHTETMFLTPLSVERSL